jgi:hypothetical protein
MTIYELRMTSCGMRIGILHSSFVIKTEEV